MGRRRVMQTKVERPRGSPAVMTFETLRRRIDGHPNVVPFLEFTDAYVITPWYTGGPLGDGRRFDVAPDLCHILAGACEGLQWLHERGLATHGAITKDAVYVDVSPAGLPVGVLGGFHNTCRIFEASTANDDVQFAAGCADDIKNMRNAVILDLLGSVLDAPTLQALRDPNAGLGDLAQRLRRVQRSPPRSTVFEIHPEYPDGLAKLFDSAYGDGPCNQPDDPDAAMVAFVADHVLRHVTRTMAGPPKRWIPIVDTRPGTDRGWRLIASLWDKEPKRRFYLCARDQNNRRPPRPAGEPEPAPRSIGDVVLRFFVATVESTVASLGGLPDRPDEFVDRLRRLVREQRVLQTYWQTEW